MMIWLGRLIYRIATLSYFWGIRLVAPFHSKAALWTKGRRDIQQHLRQLPERRSLTIWMHCASLGEFEQGRPLLEAIRNRYPAATILLTFFSPSGFEVRKQFQGADAVTYLPLDTPSGAARFLDTARPDIAIFIKYEFWYFCLRELHNRKIPVFLFAGIFRPQQIFFRWYGAFHRSMLQLYAAILVQNISSQHLLESVGIKSTVAPDLRFDRVLDIARQPVHIEVMQRMREQGPVLICGSTWPEDDAVILKAYKSTLRSQGFRLILAPHLVDAVHIQKVMQLYGSTAVRFSEQYSGTQVPEMLILDSIGVLASAYRYAHFAFIGGAWGAGLHNTLEAAVYGIPVVFGKNYSKFNEAVELITAGAGFSVADATELEAVLLKLHGDEVQYLQSSSAAAAYVQERSGGTLKALAALAPYLSVKS